MKKIIILLLQNEKKEKIHEQIFGKYLNKRSSDI